MPSEEWKIKNYKQKWYAGETISVSIGQGAVAVTPIQLARAIGAVASDGVLVRPHIAFPISFPRTSSRWRTITTKAMCQIDEDNWLDHHRCHGRVLHRSEPRGSAHLHGIDFAGKTGSAQTDLQSN